MKNCLLIAALLLGVTAAAQQTAKGLTASNNVFIGYYEYKPVNYDANPTTKYPLIIFLHGIGERGNGTTELSKVASTAIPRYIQDGDPMTFTWNGKTETFLVLSPQLSSNYGSWQTFYVEEMIRYAKQNLRIDTNRIILTGLSLGGGGVWSYAAGSLANAKKLAAISPVCGTCQNVSWCNIANANLPTWGFHAQDDGTVPSSCTNGAVTAINNCNGAVKAYKTIWPTGQHWIWDRAYDRTYGQQNPNVFEWFIAQNKSLPANKLPVANGGPDITTNTANPSVGLDASASADSDGSIVRYVWRMVSGPTQVNFGGAYSTSPVVTASGLTVAGTYQFELKVVDNRADWSTDLVTVTVSSGGTTPPSSPPPVNKPAVAKAGNDITITLPANTATLDGTASYDPDGALKAYEWTKLAGPAQFTITNNKNASTTVTNLVAGTYSFKLTVWGDNWVPVNDTVNVTVNAATVPPPAGNTPVATNAGVDITITLPVNKTILDGSATMDVDGEVKAYEWTKISGPSGCVLNDPKSSIALATSLTAGTYQFRLTAWGDNWVPRADTVTVIVKAPETSSNIAPIVSAGAPCHVTLPSNTATLNGSESYDMDGSIVAWQWSKISGPDQYTLADAASATTSLNNLVQGTYRFRLQATDNNNAINDDTVTVQVYAAPNLPAVPVAGNDIVISLPQNSISVDGSASYDPDGVIKSYEWRKISGPASYSISNYKSAKATISNLVTGTYQFELMVWGDNWVPKADTIQVFVTDGVAAAVNISTSLRVAENVLQPVVKIYPSPAKERINMQYQGNTDGQATAIIYDMNGKIVTQVPFNKTQATYHRSLNIAHLKPGIYHMVVMSKGQKVVTSFVKQ